MAASFVSLLDKLKSPHRSVQRHAVRAIFESLRSNSSQDTFGHHHHHLLLLHSPAGKQALSDCLLLSSRSAPALDEAISQLCYLAIGQKSPSSADNEDDGEPILALFHLQALLECSPPEAVPSIVRCIVFVCRFLIAKRWSVLQGLLSHELHPLIKAFESRQESHLEIIQQVIVMLPQNDLTKKDTECLHFLEPLLNYLAVNSTLRNERYLVIRELCFNIASLVSSNFATGRFLMRLLLCFNSQQTQDSPLRYGKSISVICVGFTKILSWIKGSEFLDFQFMKSDFPRYLGNSSFCEATDTTANFKRMSSHHPSSSIIFLFSP